MKVIWKKIYKYKKKLKNDWIFNLKNDRSTFGTFSTNIIIPKGKVRVFGPCPRQRRKLMHSIVVSVKKINNFFIILETDPGPTNNAISGPCHELRFLRNTIN